VFHPKVTDVLRRTAPGYDRDRHYCGEIHNIGDYCVEDIFLDPYIGVSARAIGSREYEILSRKNEDLEAEVKRLNVTNIEWAAEMRRKHQELATAREKLDDARAALGIPVPEPTKLPKED
jgi:hypothetical protein